MDNTHDLLIKLKQLLKWKQSKQWMASKLGITEAEVNELLKEIKSWPSPVSFTRTNIDAEIEECLSQKLLKESPIIDIPFSEPTKRETETELEVSAYWNHEPTPDEIIAKHKIDLKKWKLSTYWSKGRAKGFLVSAQFSAIKKDSSENFTIRFEDFLQKHNFQKIEVVAYSNPIEDERLTKKAVLIVNKQDAHFNKLDIGGKNDIETRFFKIEQTLETLIAQARHSAKIEKIVFVVGSDEFNSEWTGMTTKGTPQQNILSYEEAFEQICQHNLRLLSRLYLHCPNVEVLYVKGNHDEYVGWHLVQWLQLAFKRPTVTFDTSQLNRKYIRFENVGLMFNHGDQMKHKELAQIFPMEFREEWSKCVAFNIFTGDKHHEKTEDIVGIKAYQLPALSCAKSKWDDKRGYGGKATSGEMQVFLIEGQRGNTYIYKEFL